ncbi:hypothetical protein PJ311_07785 [Bacillus sp. CLL-7-23]|uniref:Uncharacterized protein n=1 Tax=Bacillus changyiensis TaxID=3004103 RepID=A0ABT4X2L6_9BACI|nr:hypothetical protein [Bacillus changyiensis]MDA7026516.1 hypothetical protein [Bacillus changyiensis]
MVEMLGFMEYNRQDLENISSEGMFFMKKKANRFMTLFLAAVMALGFLFIGSGEVVHAKKTTKEFTFHTGAGPMKSYIHTSDNYMNVYSTVEIGRFGTWEGIGYCKLYLQRYTKGSWKTIDSASGVAETGKKLNVTFKNIAKRSTPMRVKVKFYDYEKRSKLFQTVYSAKWTR